MSRFHMFKKVITWPQVWKVCNRRKLSRICEMIPDGNDKSCKLDDYTKGRCPIWNGELESLVILANHDRGHNEQRESKHHPEKVKQFREEEGN